MAWNRIPGPQDSKFAELFLRVRHWFVDQNSESIGFWTPPVAGHSHFRSCPLAKTFLRFLFWAPRYIVQASLHDIASYTVNAWSENAASLHRISCPEITQNDILYWQGSETMLHMCCWHWAGWELQFRALLRQHKQLSALLAQSQGNLVWAGT